MMLIYFCEFLENLDVGCVCKNTRIYSAKKQFAVSVFFMVFTA